MICEQEAIGRSSGGLTTKIHATTDALGNPTSIHLTPGQVHDLVGADALLPSLEVGALLADKVYDADERVIRPLEQAGTVPVIPSRSNRKTKPRIFKRECACCGMLTRCRRRIAIQLPSTFN